MSQIRSKYSMIEGKDSLMIDSEHFCRKRRNKQSYDPHSTPPSGDLGLAFCSTYFNAQKAKRQTSQSVTAASTHRTKPRHQKENPSRKKNAGIRPILIKIFKPSLRTRDLYHERQSIRFCSSWHVGIFINF